MKMFWESRNAHRNQNSKQNTKHISQISALISQSSYVFIRHRFASSKQELFTTFVLLSIRHELFCSCFQLRKKKSILFLCQRILVTEVLPNFSFKTTILYCLFRQLKLEFKINWHLKKNLARHFVFRKFLKMIILQDVEWMSSSFVDVQ